MKGDTTCVSSSVPVRNKNKTRKKSVLPLEKPTTAYLKQNSFRRITYLPILHRLWLHVKTSVTRPPCRKYRTLWKMS